MAAVAGIRGTGTGADGLPDWGPGERPKSFREGILFFQPNGTAPIFALTSRAGTKTVSDPEFSWWCETQNLVRLTTSGALVAGDTTVTVVTASTDPAEGAMERVYAQATHLKPGDLLMVEPAADAAAYNPEIIRVDNVLSSGQFTAVRGVGGTTPGSIPSGSALLLIGSSYAEGTDAPRAVSRNPVKFYNYTQIFKDAYELTGTADATEFRTGNPWSNDKKRKMFDHSRAIEMAILFGTRSETVGTNGKPQRTMGGLRDLLPDSRQVVFSTTVSPDMYLDATSPVFDFESGGGNTRIVMGGNAALTNLSKIFRSATNARMELGKVLNLYGLDLREFIMPRGRLLFYSHPLMSQHPIYSKGQFILDFDSIKYVALKGRDTKTADDIQTKGEDLRRGFIQTECSLMIDRGGLTSMYVGNIVAA